MARAVASGNVTPADELRVLLTDSEKQVTNIQGQGARAATLLANLDRIAALWPQLTAAGVDLRPEQGRWETLQAMVHRRAPGIVAELRQAGGLAALRAKETSRRGAGENGDAAAGAEPAWWWYLDQEVARNSRGAAIRTGAIVVAAVVVLVAAVTAFRLLFPVDPKVSAAAGHLGVGQQKISAGTDYSGALAEFEAAAQLTPDSPEAWAWVGATQQKLGQDPSEAFKRSRAASDSELNFRLTRAPAYTALDMLDAARADIQAALQIDPQNPQAYYFLATIEETAGNLKAAAGALQQASANAEARDDSQLVAMSRVRLGFLMQRMQANQGAEPGPTP